MSNCRFCSSSTCTLYVDGCFAFVLTYLNVKAVEEIDNLGLSYFHT